MRILWEVCSNTASCAAQRWGSQQTHLCMSNTNFWNLNDLKTRWKPGPSAPMPSRGPAVGPAHIALIEDAFLPPSTLTTKSRDNNPRTPPPAAHIFITDSYLVRSAARGNLSRRCAPLQQRFPTSSGPQLCVGKLRLLPVLPADTHASAGTIPSLHRCMKNAIKCIR